VLEVKNAEGVSRQLDQWLADVTQVATEVARGLSVRWFKEALARSPQYSGDFAANWRYSRNSGDTNFETGFVRASRRHRKQDVDMTGGEAFKLGDWPAQGVALKLNSWREMGFKLGDIVYISNSSTHDEPYAWKIENNQVKFRPQNAGAGAVAARTTAYMSQAYAVVESPRMVEQLRREKFS